MDDFHNYFNPNDRSGTDRTNAPTGTGQHPTASQGAGAAQSPAEGSADTNLKSPSAAGNRQTVGATGTGRRSGRGFAGMDPARQREIASKGGKAAHLQGSAHEFTSEEAAEAGRKGGQNSHGGGNANRSQRNQAASGTMAANAGASQDGLSRSREDGTDAGSSGRG